MEQRCTYVRGPGNKGPLRPSSSFSSRFGLGEGATIFAYAVTISSDVQTMSKADDEDEDDEEDVECREPFVAFNSTVLAAGPPLLFAQLALHLLKDSTCECSYGNFFCKKHLSLNQLQIVLKGGDYSIKSRSKSRHCEYRTYESVCQFDLSAICIICQSVSFFPKSVLSSSVIFLRFFTPRGGFAAKALFSSPSESISGKGTKGRGWKLALLFKESLSSSLLFLAFTGK